MKLLLKFDSVDFEVRNMQPLDDADDICTKYRYFVYSNENFLTL